MVARWAQPAGTAVLVLASSTSNEENFFTMGGEGATVFAAKSLPRY